MAPPTALNLQSLISCALEDIRIVQAAARTVKFEQYERELIELLEMVQGPTKKFTDDEIKQYQEIAAAAAEARHAIKPRDPSGSLGDVLKQEQARQSSQSMPAGHWDAETASLAAHPIRNRTNCEHQFVRVSLVNRPNEHHSCDLCRAPLQISMMQCIRCPMRACEICERNRL